MAEPITGRNAELTLDNASGTPTDISDYISVVTKTADTEEFETRIFKRTRIATTRGMKKEDWEIKGPWSEDAETFFRALEALPEGTVHDYILKPDDAANFAWVGTCLFKHYEPDSIDAGAVINYTARLSVLTKTVSSVSP